MAWISLIFNPEDINYCFMTCKSSHSTIIIILHVVQMSAGVTVNCVHPGLTYTRTWKFLPNSLQPVFKFILKVFFKVCNAHISFNSNVFQMCCLQLHIRLLFYHCWYKYIMLLTRLMNNKTTTMHLQTTGIYVSFRIGLAWFRLGF